MTELILLVGILVLFVLHMQLRSRFAQLEQHVFPTLEPRHEAAAPPDPIPPREMAAWLARPPEPSVSVSDMPGEEAPEAESGEQEETPAPARETLAMLFERFVGGRLLIWIGGLALAVAGILLVRYSIQHSFATPPVRMAMAAVFGFLLLAAGEYARSRPDSALDPRIGQALVGAGILVLYATPYGALMLYQLISNSTATVLMVMVTAVALVLSLRHGAPSAVMGLVGGFATPLLVGDPDSGAVPLLTYLALLDIALFVVARRRGWAWLAVAAVLLSFGWAFSLTVAPVGDALAGGLFVVGLGIAASLVRPGPGRQLAFLRPVGIGLLQLALLVGRTDLGLPAWGLFGALALAAILLSSRRPEYRPLPAFALGLALILLAAQAYDAGDRFAPLAAAVTTALFGASALAGALRGRARTLWTAVGSVAFAAPAIVLRDARPELLVLPAWGGLMILLALGPAALGWLRRKAEDGALAVAAASVLLLLGIAAYDLVPRDLLATAWLLLAAAAAFAATKASDRFLPLLALAGAAFAILWAAAMVPGLWSTIGYSIGGVPALVTGLPSPLEALELLILPAAASFAVWHWLPESLLWPRRFMLAAAGIFLAGAAYILVKQVFALSSPADFMARGFAERLLITQALFAAGWILGGGRVRLLWLDGERIRLIGTILTALAAARLLWFDIAIHDPALVIQRVGPLPVLNLLAPAYLLSAFWLYAARRRTAEPAASGVWLGLFLAALIAGVMLMVRQAFHGAILTDPALPNAEFYGYSLAGLLLSIALMLFGNRLPDKALRVAGLALLTATILKVFLVDAAALEGILRILSFLGLGVAVIGVGKLYATVLSVEAKPKET